MSAPDDDRDEPFVDDGDPGEDDARSETLTIPASLHGTRLDAGLASLLDLSRNATAALVRDGHVSAEGRPLERAARKLREGEVLHVTLPAPTPIDAQPEAIPLVVVYEDEDLIVIDKPSGMVVHPAPGHPGGTLVNALLHHCGDLSGIGGRVRPGIVHRIDRDTSGLLVVTKNDRAHQHLAAQFAAHTIERVYDAIAVRTSGAGLEELTRFDTPHARHPEHRKRFTGRHGGTRRARTDVAVIARYADGAMHVRCTLSTGRTHQIRVHLAEHGCPLLGDPIYGGRAVVATRLISRLALHAAVLGFEHPDGRALYFTSPPPHDIQQALDRLERGETWRA